MVPQHLKDNVLLALSWITTYIVGMISLQTLPIIFSCVVSVMAGVNYWFQIKKNKRDSEK